MTRRNHLPVVALILLCQCGLTFGQTTRPAANLALVATPSASFVSPHEFLSALNDGFDPRRSEDKSRGAYGNWPRRGTQWVQYDWPQPISTDKIDVYWFIDGGGVRAPASCRLLYWDGSAFVPIKDAEGLGLEQRRYNTTTFPEITTTKLRLEIDPTDQASTGILEWKVYDTGKSPNFAPAVVGGIDRVVVMPGKTYLSGRVRDDAKVSAAPSVQWSKQSGPGTVTFENPGSEVTTAKFSAPGSYVLSLTADDGQAKGSGNVNVRVEPPPPSSHLQVIETRPYKLNSPLWNHRAKALIVNWIPYCMDQCSKIDLREGGINNLIQAGNKLAGKEFTPHRGFPFSNAWVLNTVEAMCVALQVDPQGDQEIIDAQNKMKAKLDEWIPIILAAQEPDGYFQTRYTLGRGARETAPPERWSARMRSEHEGYVAGYFLEAGIAHYLSTGGKDTRLYDAAKKLADCWYNNLGPEPKKKWFDGHQEMELALVRFGRFVNDTEGAGKGQKYIELAKFLLDCRGGGGEYDQSHAPVQQQYEAVGHAVRAVYSYTGMADVALETGDVDYHSAVHSLWDNIVNKKYYVTGGVGTGETSEGFGPNYSLRNNAYCESCSGSGELFFQHRLHLTHGHSKYADLYEETLYNALLGDIDLAGKNFYYQNPLDARGARYAWHNCPCCVGNIPRTLLMLPSWMYAKDKDSVYVNLFIGGTVPIGKVAGTDVELVQQTDYPWNGKVVLTVNPASQSTFAVEIRVPGAPVSELYTATPRTGGIGPVAVNGAPVDATPKDGYVTIGRAWKAGDKVEFTLPLVVQRIKTDAKVRSNEGLVSLRYGPLVYNFESTDQNLDLVLDPKAPLTTEFKPDLLGGVMVIKGQWAGGEPLMAIPNYARMNRGGRSTVWVRDQ